jgi:uncharacterized protein (UPF0335 family)
MAKEATARGNGYDPNQLKTIVGKIEACFADLLSERGAYMNRCRGIRQGITAAYDEAKALGIPKKELRTLVKTRELQGKIEAQVAALEADEKETYAMLIDSLGDFGNLPLGAAALDRAKPKGETLDNLTQ